MGRLLPLVLLVCACAKGSAGDDDDDTAIDAPAAIDAAAGIDGAGPPDARIIDAVPVPDAPPDASTATSCLTIKTANPASPDGPYTIDPGTGSIQVYCDMTHGGVTYVQLAQGNHLGTYAGYTQVSIADLADAVIQQAFIWLYNNQSSSIINIDMTFTTANCCIMAADSGTSMLGLGADNYLYPATTAGIADCNSQYLASAYRFWIVTPNVFSPVPMPTTFFATYPANLVANCSVDNNPAWFFKKYQ